MDDLNTVELQQPEGAEDDAQFDEGEQLPEANELPEEVHNEPEDKKEPGWMKKRIETAVRKQLAQAVSSAVNAEREKWEEQLAPLRKAQIENQADKLVASGEFKSRETAIEYLTLKSGAPVAEKKEAPPVRTDASVEARAKALMVQARTIQSVTGLDVLSVYNENEQVKKAVLAGEMDFADVAKAMNKQHVPQPTRNPNGASAKAVSFKSMSEKQFAEFNRRLEEGQTIELNE